MNNLHVCLNEFRFESRVLKQTRSLVNHGIAGQIFIAALHGDGLSAEEDVGRGVRVRRFRLGTRGWGKNLFAQQIKYVEFLVRVFICYRKKQVQLITVHSLDLLPFGVVLKVLLRARLVYDTHELETEKLGLRGARKQISQLVERCLIGAVDLTITVSESIADWYVAKYRITRPAVVLNAPRPRSGVGRRDLLRRQLGVRTDQVIVLYQGGFVRGRGIEIVLQAFRERTDDGIVLVLMGYGELESEIRSAANQCAIIFCVGAVEPDDLLEYTASADIGISLVEPLCLSYEFSLPNKLFEYAMAGLPVLVGNTRDTAAFVLRHRMGLVIRAWSAAAVNAALDTIVTGDRRQMAQNSFRAACAHSWDVQEAVMLASYSRMLHTHA